MSNAFSKPQEQLPPWLNNQGQTRQEPVGAAKWSPPKGNQAAPTQSPPISQPRSSGGYSQQARPKAVKHFRFVLAEPNPQFKGSGDCFFGSLTDEGKAELWDLANKLVQGLISVDDIRIRVNTYSFVDEVKNSGEGYFKKTVAGGVLSIKKKQ